MGRLRAIATDIDRIAAARVAADKLRDLMTEPNGRWIHFIDSGGGVHSELDKRALNERHTPESLGVSGLSGPVPSTLPVLARRRRRSAA